MSEQSHELQLELELANLLWPDFQKSYNENGDYWYMNDVRVPGANFKGYVPKWTRDNDACLRLMSEHRTWPQQLVGGIAIDFDDHTSREPVACVMYEEVEQPEYVNDEEHRLHCARLAVVQGVINKTKTAIKEVQTKSKTKTKKQSP